MRKRLIVVSVASAALGLVLVALAATISVSPDQKDQIRAADRAASAFDLSLDQYVGAANAVLTAANAENPDDYQGLLKVTNEQISVAPDMPKSGTTAYGRQRSGRYREAVARRRLVLRPYQALGDYLTKRAIPDSRFIAAGKKLVRVDPGKELGDVVVVDGEPLRDLVVPAFKKARSRVEDQAPPPGEELLLRDLVAYANGAVEMTKDGADSIDQRKPFFFDFGKRPGLLFKRLLVVEASIERAVALKVDTLDTVR